MKETKSPPSVCDSTRLRKRTQQSEEPELDYSTHDVARVLREEVVYGRRIRLGCIIYAPTSEAKATAGLLRDGLSGSHSPWLPRNDPFEGLTRHRTDVEITDSERAAGIDGTQQFSTCESALLNPALPRTRQVVREAQKEIADRLKAADAANGNAVLVVGHQPQLGWLSEQLTAGFGWRQWRRLQWWSSGPVPITSGEIVCLRIETKRSADKKWGGHMLWSIHPDDSARLSDVREKVQSKLKSAELLAAVLGLAIAAVLALLLDRTRWRNLSFDGDAPRPLAKPFGLEWLAFEPRTGVQISVLMLISALAMYLMTVYAYDSLRMPPTFWGEKAPRQGTDSSHRRFRDRWLPRRPPSSSTWVIYRNMMRVWGTLFVPATLLVLASFITLAVSLLDFNGTVWAWIPAVAILAVLLIWRRLTRPVLGSED